jgi:hypothetical protein
VKKPSVHARRKLFDEHARTKSPIALQALEKIGAVFAVERWINGPERRGSARRPPGAERSSCRPTRLHLAIQAAMG